MSEDVDDATGTPGDGTGRGQDALRLPSLRRLIPNPSRIPGRRPGRVPPRDLRDELSPPRDIGDVIVDCALYQDGRRTGSVPMTEALERARAVDGFVWIGLREPSQDEFAEIAARFGLPPLAVEDAVRAHQRPKLE